MATTKKIALFLFISAVALILSAALYAQTPTIVLSRGGDGGVFRPDVATLAKPGSVIELPDTCTYIYLGELKGTPDKPITFIGKLGKSYLFSGFNLGNCQYVNIQGSPSRQIEINSGVKDRAKISEGTGVSIEEGFAKCIRVDNVIFKNLGYGIRIKNEVSCNSALNKWVIDSISVTNCMADNIKYQFAYGGSTNLNGVRPVNCNGKTTDARPASLGNIIFKNNIINGTGRAAFQLSFADVGLSEIAFNTLSNIGREYTDGQGNGINIGTYSKVWVHDNKIRNTLVAGIAAYSPTWLKAENNTIDSSGYLDGYTTIWAWGIWIDSRDTLAGTTVKLLNNKIGKRGAGGPKDNGWQDILVGDSYGEKYGRNTYSDSSVISGNVSTLTGNAAVLSTAKTFKFSTVVAPVPPAPVLKTIIRKGYYTPTGGKRTYYILYSDFTYKFTNSKYVPL